MKDAEKDVKKSAKKKAKSEGCVIEHPKLVSELQEMINDWMNAHPKRSLTHLSQATGVPEALIRRLMNNGIKILDDFIFKILVYVFEIKVFTFEDITDALLPGSEARKWFLYHYSYLEESLEVREDEKDASVEEMIFRNPISTAIYFEISQRDYISPSHIRQQFGLVGTFELARLLRKQIVVLGSNGVLRPKDPTLKLTEEQVRARLSDLAQTFRKKDQDL